MLTRVKFSLSWLWGVLSVADRFLQRNQKQVRLWLYVALTPWLCFWGVEMLCENDIFALKPWQWCMNLVWYYFLLFVGWLITGRRKGAIAFDLLFSFVAGLANHYVLEFRGRALFPIDLLSLGTAANVAGNYDYTPDQAVNTVALLLVFFLVLLFFGPRDRKRNFGRKWVKWVNLAISFGWGVYIVLFFFTSMLPSMGVYAQQWKTKGNGFLLNFTVSASYMHMNEPEGYDGAQVEQLLTTLEGSDAAGDRAPVTNFIIVMNESFADLTWFESLELTGDPTPYLHSLKENVIQGKMISPVTGGGTAAVEFEVLTGNNMAFLPGGTVAYQMYLTESTASLARVAEAYSVRSSAYHPYLSSGWNRTQAYKRLGFDAQYYEDLVLGEDITDEYSEEEIVREYVSDSADFARLYQLTDKARQTGENSFIFNVTMQNHSGYGKAWNNLERGVLLAGDYRGNGYDNTTHQYLALATATDEAIEELLTYYASVEEKTVILFFGDHQPPLNNDLYEKIYGKELDERTLDEVMQQYEVPFFIWANYDIEEQECLVVGSSFLGVLASQVAGYPQTGYMKFLSRVNEEFAAITPVAYVLADGTVCGDREVLTPYQQELLEQYEHLQYYNLFDDGVESGFFTIDS